jgi:hypothetical protein
MQNNSNNPNNEHNSDGMRDDYTDMFSNSTPMRGKYYEQAMREKGFVHLEPELMRAFPNNAEVNAALRSLVDGAGGLVCGNLVIVSLRRNGDSLFKCNVYISVSAVAFQYNIPWIVQQNGCVVRLLVY